MSLVAQADLVEAIDELVTAKVECALVSRPGVLDVRDAEKLVEVAKVRLSGAIRTLLDEVVP